MVGPFIFFDQMGPAEFVTGQGIDVRPHPHIGLATVTYLFDGEIMHRDSLGTRAADQARRGQLDDAPGAASSIPSAPRRTREAERRQKLFGIQSWVALPRDARGERADFRAPRCRTRCRRSRASGKSVRLIVGSAFGKTSPVQTASEMFYADVALEPRRRAAARCRRTRSARSMSSRGEIEIAGDRFEAGAAAGVPAGRPHHASGPRRRRA